MNGKEVLNGVVAPSVNRIDISKFAAGIYTIKLEKYPSYSYKLFKK